MTGDLWKKFDNIKHRKPCVHCITNEVTVRDCANILLAAGASPVMAHHPKEVSEITRGADALVCNMGAINYEEAMEVAMLDAVKAGHPIVIDPVGVASSTYRREKCARLIQTAVAENNDQGGICIRGNYSEIKALLLNCITSSGVDATLPNMNEDELLKHSISIAKQYAEASKTIVAMSGATDVITDGTNVILISNGTPYMKKITGSGCMTSSLIGASLVLGQNPLEAVAAAVTVMGICGEIAEEKCHQIGGGTMTFENYLIDEISLLTESDFIARAKVLQQL